MAFFKKPPFLPSQASKAVRPPSAKRADEFQNGLFGNGNLNGLNGLLESKWHFSKNPFLHSQTIKAVKTLIAKRANEVQNRHFGNEAFNGLNGLQESELHFRKTAVFALTGQ